MSKIPDKPDALLNEIQAAAQLNLSSRTLQAWRNKCVGPPFVRAGRAIRYRLIDLQQWTAAQVVRPATGASDVSEAAVCHLRASGQF